MHSFLYGPVFSRRLGSSLGIDLVPPKTCSFDCVYCECGATTRLTTERSRFFPESEILAEVDRVLRAGPDAEYVTFAGSGEPTLSLSLGPVIRHIKEQYPGYRVAVITNGSLCWQPKVIADLIPADLIIPTLSSAREETFLQVQRPAPGLSVNRIIDGLVGLRVAFPGEIRLEVFLVPPLNTTRREIAALRHVIRRIQPDRVQLNTLDRPGTEGWVRPVPVEEMEAIRAFLEKGGQEVDVIGPEEDPAACAISADLTIPAAVVPVPERAGPGTRKKPRGRPDHRYGR